jgi:hypothetical protein
MRTTVRLSLAAAAAAWLLSNPALAAAPRVIASLTQPPGGLDCGRAAEEARVVFDFREPRSEIKQLSIFVNGKGVREEDIDQEWPRVTVLGGLHRGRNTVEAVVTGPDKKAVAHKLTVLVGESPDKDERDVAIVDCERRTDVADSDEPWGEEVLDEDEVVDEFEDDVEYVEEVVYDGPRYVYYPYPAFGYVVYQPAYYYPWPYYYSHYYYPHRHSYYYGGHGHRHGGSAWLNARDHRSGSGSRDSSRRSYRPNRPATHGDAPGRAYERAPAPSRSEAPSRTMTRSERSAPAPRGDSHRGGGRAYDRR